MKGKLTKKLIGILLSGVILIYLFSGISFADTTQIDLSSLETIGEEPTTTTGNTNAPANNIVNTVENNTIANTSVLPQTGSNNEIIFVAGLTILIGTTVYIYKKTRIF